MTVKYFFLPSNGSQRSLHPGRVFWAVAGPGVGAPYWVFAAERGLSLFAESGDYSPVSV